MPFTLDDGVILERDSPRAQRAAERERAGREGSARLCRVEERGGAPLSD